MFYEYNKRLSTIQYNFYHIFVIVHIGLLFQTQISLSKWPHDGFWPQLIEKYNMTYKSRRFTAMEYNKYTINGPECDGSGTYLESKNALEDYRDDNLIKVSYALELL